MKARYLGQCIHEWVIAAPGAEFTEVCVNCGAEATRDEKGKINLYDARVPIEPRQERKKPKSTAKKPARAKEMLS